MKQTALFIGFFLMFAPTLAFAQALPTCSAKGYTVVFVNGVFDTYEEALDDSTSLNQKISFQYHGEPLTVQLGYNPTHIVGIGDSLQSVAQQFNTSLSDFDLDTILMQIYPEVTTRKLLVVGHSQGADYANEMYSYLLAHGEPKEAVGVYAVGTPASSVAGGGKYITSTNDKVVNIIATAAATALQDGVHISQPLPGNVTLPLSPADAASTIGGHAFTDVYLAQAAPQITSDIGGELSALQPTDASANSDCFTPPSASVGYKTQQVLFAVGDPTATVLKVGAFATFQAGAVAIKTVSTLAAGALQLVADAVTFGSTPPSPKQTTAKTETIVNKLYGSSLDGLSPQDKKELLGSSQGGAVVLAGVVLGTSTEPVPATTPSTPPSIFPSSSNGPVVGGGGGGSASVIVVANDNVAADPVIVDDSTATNTTTDDTGASTTPPVVDDVPPAPPALPTGAPIVDTFDQYSADPAASAWSVWPPPSSFNYFARFIADTGHADTLLASVAAPDARFVDTVYTGANDCHSGNCLIPDIDGGGLGGGGHSSIMFRESGVGQDSGAFTIWARTRAGWRAASASVGLCAGVSLGCAVPNVLWLDPLGTSDDAWHQYYIAWRQGNTNVETCIISNYDTGGGACTWVPTIFPTGTQFDGVFLGAGAVRQDLGDQAWFDDLGEAPTQ